jgi:hypothetical protein
VTSEFRHGTITPSFLVTPLRGFFRAAKLVAEPLLGGLLGLFNIDGVADYLRAAVLYAIPGHMTGGLSFLPAVLVGLAHISVVMALAVLRTSRRDIT